MSNHTDSGATNGSTGLIVVAWALVSIPLVYGVTETLIRVSNLFTG